jgi:DNA-binding MarR family transcriptional regulator
MNSSGRTASERMDARITPAHVPTVGAEDPESRLAADHHDALRVWLRLLTCTMTIERGIRARLRERFALTLPRFDLMAQLERHPAGLKMSELSRRLMVTGGNVTGLTDQLVDEGWVERRAIPGDRRAFAVRLTPKGKAAFDVMATEHERWVIEMMDGITGPERDALHALLGRLKASLQAKAGPPQGAVTNAAKPRANEETLP